MLNKNTLGVKKVRGQSEAIKRWPSDKANRQKYIINYCISFKELKVF